MLVINNNNPFAIIQLKPNKWKGLVGKRPNGFLTFDSVTNGIRAGFVNLANMLKKYPNTNKLFDIYTSDGMSASENYKRVAEKNGLPRDRNITTMEDFRKLGRTIIQVEAGKFWVKDIDFQKGLEEAMSSGKLTSFMNTKAGIVAGGGGLAIVFLILSYVLFFK